MGSRSRITGLLFAMLAVLGLVLWWRQAELRVRWWDALASRGPDADALGALQACDDPGWSGWVTVAAADLAMPCGEPLAARQLSERLDPSLRRTWIRRQLDRQELSARVRWRLTRALELSGGAVPTATVTLLLEGDLGPQLATELMLADGGPRDPRERWMASTLRAARGEPADTFPWGSVVDAAWVSGDHSRAVSALRASLQVPEGVDLRLHSLPEGWARYLSPALECTPTERSCLRRWARVMTAWERAPDGEDLPRLDVADAPTGEVDVGLLEPLLAYEGADVDTRIAVSRLLEEQALDLTLEGARPWLGVGVGGAAPTLPRALWTGRMGPWVQALWAREVMRRGGSEGGVRRSPDHLVVSLGSSPRTLCGDGKALGLEVVLDVELVARGLLELHPEAAAAASRLAGWTGPDHAIFGGTGAAPPPPDPCSEPSA